MADVSIVLGAGLLDAYGKEIPVANNVRLNRDGTGPRSVPDEVPYMPQSFPVSPPEGWKITGVFARDKILKPHLWPFYISTNAYRMVPEWTVDSTGKFLKATGIFVHDVAYGIHFSDLDFTQGCVRVIQRSDLEWLAAQVQDELNELRKLNPAEAWVSLEVVA
jgi:hypothetical protein